MTIRGRFLMQDQNWLPAPRAFLAWNGRIGRRAYFVGWLVIGLTTQLLGLTLHYLPIGSGAWWLELILVCAALLSWSSLMTQRAHDIGMSAAPPLIVLVGWSALSLVMADFQNSLLGDVSSRFLYSRHVEERDIFPLYLAGVAVLVPLHVFLFVKRGQSGS